MILEASINGDKTISAELSTVGLAVKDWRTPLASSGSELMKSFQLNFEESGALFGGWLPRKKSYPWPLLRKTGHLQHSFYSDVTSTQLTLGNRASYFKYHQRGTSRLPKRVMLMIDAARQNFIIKAFQAHIVAARQRVK